MARLRLIRFLLLQFLLPASVFHLHVHIDGPNVHALWVIGDDAFEHGAGVLRPTVLVLEHGELGDYGDVAGLGQGLQRPREDSLRVSEGFML